MDILKDLSLFYVMSGTLLLSSPPVDSIFHQSSPYSINKNSSLISSSCLFNVSDTQFYFQDCIWYSYVFRSAHMFHPPNFFPTSMSLSPLKFSIYPLVPHFQNHSFLCRLKILLSNLRRISLSFVVFVHDTNACVISVLCVKDVRGKRMQSMRVRVRVFNIVRIHHTSIRVQLCWYTLRHTERTASDRSKD